MVRLEVEVELAYEVNDSAGADFVFNIHAAQTAHQTVERESLTVDPPVFPDVTTDPSTETRIMRLHADPGPLRIRYAVTVSIDHYVTEPDTLAEVPVRHLPVDVVPYVYPSRYCESDRLLKLAFDEFGGMWQGYSRVLAIQHWVQKRVTFASNTSNAHTSAVDTLVERVGVCRDFTHLMIALCRAVNIPARIVTGTDFGADPALGPPDFHAYVEAYLGDRWYLFDASGTGVPMGFIRIATGRDAADVAFATIFGNVSAGAPLIRVCALEGADLEVPAHRREALSTTAMSVPRAGGIAVRDAIGVPLVAHGAVTQQLPD